MVRSNIRPETIWLRKTEMKDDQLYLILRVRTNISEVPVLNEKDGKEVTHYDYDETEVRYPVPEGVTTLDAIKTLIANEAAAINAKAAKETAWKAIAAKPVVDIREALKAVSVIEKTP